MDKYGILFDIIDKSNKLAEELRQQKVVGKRDEYHIAVEFYGNVNEQPGDLLAFVMCEQILSAWCGTRVYTNTLGPKLTSVGDLLYDVYLVPIKNNTEFADCGRCFKYAPVTDAPDNLCERCIKVMIECYPEHERTPAILAYLQHREAQNVVI